MELYEGMSDLYILCFVFEFDLMEMLRYAYVIFTQGLHSLYCSIQLLADIK